MAFDFTSECIATAGALVGGVWLGYVVATRSSRRRVWTALLWIWVAMPLLFSGRSRMPAETFGALPLAALCACSAFDGGREQRNAARSLGAPEWRIFWRVMLPMAWRGVCGAGLLVILRVAVAHAIVAVP